MSDDCDDGPERELPDLSGGSADASLDTIIDPADASILVTRPKDTFPLNARSDRDVHSSVTHGLASYMAAQSRNFSGRQFRLASVIADWPDRDDGARPYPAAAVYSIEKGTYEESGMTPASPDILEQASFSSAISPRPSTGTPDQFDALGTAGISITAIYRLDELRVEVTCGDKFEREQVRRMLEDASSPVHWMGGFRLVLPAYHNSVCEFDLMSAVMDDSPEAIEANVRRLVMIYTVWCPVYRVYKLPLARPQTRGTIAGRG